MEREKTENVQIEFIYREDITQNLCTFSLNISLEDKITILMIDLYFIRIYFLHFLIFYNYIVSNILL